MQSLYNIVDSLFIAKVSGLALDAVSFAFPMQQIMLAFALGIGVGTSTIVARRLGEKNKADADKLAQTGFKLAIITTAVFMIMGSFLPRLFMMIFTKDTNIVNMGHSGQGTAPFGESLPSGSTALYFPLLDLL